MTIKELVEKRKCELEAQEQAREQKEFSKIHDALEKYITTLDDLAVLNKFHVLVTQDPNEIDVFDVFGLYKAHTRVVSLISYLETEGFRLVFNKKTKDVTELLFEI